MTGDTQGELWIVIPRWDGPTGFQHYKDRDPKWIKVYTRLMTDDAYLSLTGNRRAILHGLWLEYAMSNRCIALDIKMISRRLALNVKMTDIEALNHAGFLHVSASKPLAKPEQNASLEEEVYKEEKSLRPLSYAGKIHSNHPQDALAPLDFLDLLEHTTPEGGGATT